MVEKADSCYDGQELFRLSKQRAGVKRGVVRVSYFEDESRVKKGSVDDLRGIYEKVDEW